MDKVLLIIRHEYLTRIRKKSFWLVSLLTPILIVALVALVAFLISSNKQEDNKIAVIDNSKQILSQFEDNKTLIFIDGIQTGLPIDSLKKELTRKKYQGLLVIPADTTRMLNVVEKGTELFYAENMPIDVKSSISRQINSAIKNSRLEALGIDNELLKESNADVNLASYDVSSQDIDKDTSLADGIKLGLSMMLNFMLYMFILLTGSMVMNSTLEEKTSRVIEVIISSVRPFQLMFGKIISAGLVALTQLGLWLVTIFGLSAIGLGVFGAFSAEEIGETIATTSPEAQQIMEATSSGGNEMIMELMGALSQIDFLSIFLIFIVFFVLGYLLYASLFAAAGSAVDSPNDAGQFMIPLTIPLILALYIGMTCVNNPHGPIAFWASMIPFTSPIVMMVRIPFGVPAWEVILSVVILIITIIICVWIAGKIYRVGLLMYGTKPTYKDLWHWIKSS